MKLIYSPIIPIEKRIIPSKNKLAEESIATPNWKVFQNKIFEKSTTVENKNPSEPKNKPPNVIYRIGFLDKVTKPKMPKSIRNNKEALLLPFFLFGLLKSIHLRIESNKVKFLQ